MAGRGRTKASYSQNTGQRKRRELNPAREKRYERANRRSFTQYDYALLFMTIGIALFGVVMVYSSGYYKASVLNEPFRFVKQQLRGLVLGLGLMLIISQIEFQVFYQTIKKIGSFRLTLAYLSYLVALVLQIAVLFIGDEYNGAKRWITIGPIQFQPSEISKIAAILFVACAIYQNRSALDSFFGFLRIVIYMAPLIILIAAENLSSAIIVAGITVGMCFVASRKIGYFVVGIAVIIGLISLYVAFGDPFRMERIQIWMDVENHPKALQIRQGLYAIASGGIFGSGLGQSMQKLGFIPEAYNDMIFSVICEELGIVGAVMLMIAFLVLFWRIIVIACHAPDLFGTMICAGVMIQLAIQVIINIAVVTNTIPSTGIPLPFISYGGTSIMIMLAEMGLVLGVSRQVKQK